MVVGTAKYSKLAPTKANYECVDWEHVNRSFRSGSVKFCPGGRILPPPDPVLVGTTAEGTPAIPTAMDLEFLNTSAEDSYSFTLTDSVSNISTTITNYSVDLTNTFSKDSFVEKINLSLRSAQTDTTITGSTQMTSSGTSAIDITDSAKFANTQFSISLDGGPLVQVDIRQRLSSTNGVDTASVTQTNIVTALQSELQRLFDDRITVGTANGSFTITDDEGRRLKVAQDIGNGFLFGTDAVNCGPLVSRETERNNLSVTGKKILYKLKIKLEEKLY